MIGCSSSERRSNSRGTFSLSLSPVISNNYGNHYEPRFSHRSRARYSSLSVVGQFRFHSRLRYRAPPTYDWYSPLLSSFSFSSSRLVSPPARLFSCVHADGHVRKRTILGFTVQFRSPRRVAGRIAFSPPVAVAHARVPTFLTVKLSPDRASAAVRETRAISTCHVPSHLYTNVIVDELIVPQVYDYYRYSVNKLKRQRSSYV